MLKLRQLTNTGLIVRQVQKNLLRIEQHKMSKQAVRMQDLQDSEDAATQISTAVKPLSYCMDFWTVDYFGNVKKND